MVAIARRLFIPDAPAGIPGQTLGIQGDGTATWLNSTVPFPRLVEDYGADPTGVTDSSSAIQNAANLGLPVYAAPGTYLGHGIILHDAASFFSLTPSFYNVAATGGVVFKKNANGPLFTCNGHAIRFFGCSIDGNGATYSDVGISMGTESSDFRWLWGDITHTAGYCVEWPNSNTGTREIFAYGTFYQLGATLPAFHLPPADTNATDKQFVGIFCQGGDLADFNGCQTVLVSHCDFRNCTFGAASHKVTMVGNRLATVAADTTIFGLNHTIVGNTHAGRFVIDATAANCTVGPNVTINPSVNNSPTCNLIDAFNGVTTISPIAASDHQTTVASLTSARTGGAAAALPPQPVKYLALRDELGNRVYVPAYS